MQQNVTRKFRRTRKVLRRIYDRVKLWEFGARKYLLGFDNANGMLRVADRQLGRRILRAYGCALADHVDLNTPIEIHNAAEPTSGETRVRYDKLVVGDHCHIGRDCFFDLSERVVLEDHVCVAMRSTFITHIAVGQTALKALYPTERGAIRLRRDTYLGAGVTVLKGVELGPNCLVAAGSVVTKSFPPDSLIAGVPARLVRRLEAPETQAQPETSPATGTHPAAARPTGPARGESTPAHEGDR